MGRGATGAARRGGVKAMGIGGIMETERLGRGGESAKGTERIERDVLGMVLFEKAGWGGEGWLVGGACVRS